MIKNTAAKKYFSIFLVIYPILDIYDSFFAALSIGDILVVVAMLYLILFKGYSFLYNKETLWFLGYIIIHFGVNCILYNFQSSIVFSYFGLLFNVVIFLFGLYYISGEDFNKALMIVAKVAVVYGLLQYFLRKIIGVQIPAMIEGASVLRGNTVSNAYLQDRIYSFFNEPSIFALYIAVPFIKIAYKSQYLKDFVWFVLFAVALLFTKSGNAVIILGIGAIAFLINGSISGTFKIACIGIGVLAILYLFLTGNSLVIEIFGRVSEISGHGTFYSGYVRIVRGYTLLKYESFFEWLFGIGCGALDSFIAQNSLEAFYYSLSTVSKDYLNAIQYYLIQFGIVGLVLYVKFVLNWSARKTKEGKTILLLLLLLSFVTAICANTIWLIFMFSLYTIKQEGKKGVINYNSYQKQVRQFNTDFKYA